MKVAGEVEAELTYVICIHSSHLLIISLVVEANNQLKC